jgi:nitrile hydratase accessory protein
LSERRPAAAAPAAETLGARDGPAFPTPWAARVFGLALAAQECGLFAAREWAEALGAALTRQPLNEALEPDAYWRAWLAALERLLAEKGVAAPGELAHFRDAWREAAAATPHGAPIELRRSLRSRHPSSSL